MADAVVHTSSKRDRATKLLPCGEKRAHALVSGDPALVTCTKGCK